MSSSNARVLGFVGAPVPQSRAELAFWSFPRVVQPCRSTPAPLLLCRHCGPLFLQAPSPCLLASFLPYESEKTLEEKMKCKERDKHKEMESARAKLLQLEKASKFDRNCPWPKCFGVPVALEALKCSGHFRPTAVPGRNPGGLCCSDLTPAATLCLSLLVGSSLCCAPLC